MKTRSGKNKGGTGQKHIRDIILKYYSPVLELDDVKSTTMGESGEDIQFSPKAQDLFPFVIECKKWARFSVYTIYEQAKDHCAKKNKKRGDKKPKLQPVAFIEGNYKKPLAIIDADLFIGLVAIAATTGFLTNEE